MNVDPELCNSELVARLYMALYTLCIVLAISCIFGGGILYYIELGKQVRDDLIRDAVYIFELLGITLLLISRVYRNSYQLRLDELDVVNQTVNTLHTRQYSYGDPNHSSPEER